MVLKSIGVFSLAKMMGALYAAGGFIAGLITAVMYNFVAGIAGGVELTLE